MSLATRKPPTTEEFETYRTRFNNWGRWGPDDELGTLNFITPEVRRQAAALVREGRTASLARPLATASALAGPRNHRPADHRMNVSEFGSSDYIGVDYHGFANTHIDGLCHVFAGDGRMYNGRSAADVTSEGARSNSVDRFRGGIFTRGVLYDVPRHRGTPHVTEAEPVHGWELTDIAASANITPRAGDAVVVRCGATEFWAANPDFAKPWLAPGLHASVLEFLHETSAALVVWDLMEAPGQGYEAAALPIHTIAIPYMGLPLLDNADLDDVAAACAETGRNEFLLTVAPLVVLGGTGSPVNPLAVF
jgi:kynurenine formamidase